MSRTIIIVDDNPKIFQSLSLNFQDFDFNCLWTQNEVDTIDAVQNNHVDAVLLDLSLGKENGLDILEKLLALRKGLPVVMITGFGTLEAAVKAIKMGAYDFLPKPLDFDKLYGIIDRAIKLSGGGAAQQETRGLTGPFVTNSPVLGAVCNKAKLIGRTSLSVLVVGESGSGKELLAEIIHANSERSARKMLRVNCSAFPEQLIDNEMFGHEKGAFTGADRMHRGLFEQADGGTLLLDEIGDMALPSQAKLLRVLEDKKIRRLGGNEDIGVDVRVIASTNRDLPDMIKRRQFREDLFYRLNSAFLYLPPLREHREDVPMLIDHFLKASGNAGRRFSAEAESILRAYDWPGNVRELRNVVELCAAIGANPEILPADLPATVSGGQPGAGGDKVPTHPAVSTLDEAEREMILKALVASNNNKKKASQRLGISYKTLFNKLKHHGIE